MSLFISYSSQYIVASFYHYDVDGIYDQLAVQNSEKNIDVEDCDGESDGVTSLPSLVEDEAFERTFMEWQNSIRMPKTKSNDDSECTPSHVPSHVPSYQTMKDSIDETRSRRIQFHEELQELILSGDAMVIFMIRK